MSPRERRYRRLLLLFPGRFRRQHGDALVGTLLDQEHPVRRDAPHLVAAGLGHRFRPARSPFAWAATLLVALIVGALGATAGSWAGERTYASLPDAATLAEGLAQGTGTVVSVDDLDSILFTDTILFADITLPSGADPDAAVNRARDHLAAAGWTTTEPQIEAATPGSLRQYRFGADSGGVRLSVHSFDYDGQGHLVVNGWPMPTPAYQPLVAAGLLSGLLAGWLLAVALTHRIAASALRRPAAGMLTLAIVAAAAPATLIWRGLPHLLQDLSNAESAPSLQTLLTISPWSLIRADHAFDSDWRFAALHNVLLLGLAVTAGVAAVALSVRRADEPEPVTAG